MIHLNHNGLSFSPHGPTEQEPDDLRDHMRCLMLKPPVGSHKYTQSETCVYEEHLDTDILHLCHNLQLFKLRTQTRTYAGPSDNQLVPPRGAERVGLGGGQRVDFRGPRG